MLMTVAAAAMPIVVISHCGYSVSNSSFFTFCSVGEVIQNGLWSL